MVLLFWGMIGFGSKDPTKTISNNEDYFRIKANYKKSRCQHWVALMFQPLTLFQVRNKWPWDFGWIGSYLCFINWVDQLCILHHQNLARNGRDKATIVILWIYSSFLFNLTMGYKYLYHYLTIKKISRIWYIQSYQYWIISEPKGGPRPELQVS